MSISKNSSLTTVQRGALAASTGALGLAFAAFIACSTDDPRAGDKQTGTSTSGGASSSSGGGASSSGNTIDAAAATEVECGKAPGAAASFTKAALIGAAADCAAWHACTFQNAAAGLRTSVRAHAAAPTDATLTAARESWERAVLTWSKMELFQFGPTGSRIVDPYQGRGLRSFVHPWPDTNRCQVENQIAQKGYAQSGVGTVLANARGLHAIEYVLFYQGTDTACLPASPTGQAWAALSPADLTKAKLDYATAVVDNIASVSVELRNVWQPVEQGGENFKSKLTAFEGYGSEQETLNVIGWSLFYLEREVKDLKLASRAGIAATPPNPETPFGLLEIETIRANIRAFRSLFQGCSDDDSGTGVGFDDWLVQAGHAALANQVSVAVDNAQAAADAFPSFGQASEAQFLTLYNAIKPLSDLLKTQMFGSSSVLALRLPATAASDTD